MQAAPLPFPCLKQNKRGIRQPDSKGTMCEYFLLYLNPQFCCLFLKVQYKMLPILCPGGTIPGGLEYAADTGHTVYNDIYYM